MSSTLTLNSSIEFSKRFNFGREFVIGTSLEPAMTSGNLVMQTMLGPPFAWRWNRVNTGFFTLAGVQDYFIYTTRPSNTLAQLNFFIIDNNNNSQQVTTAGTTGASAPSFNTTVGGTTTDGSAVWTNRGSFNASGLDLNLSQNYSFNWIETASIKDSITNASTSRWWELETKICLGLDSVQTRPKFVAAQLDNEGVTSPDWVSFRLMPCPDKVYPFVLTLQQKPPLFTSISQTWAPIPDEYSHIYNWGFLALMFMFADDSRFMFANGKFVSHLLAANEGLTETERNIFLNNWSYITGQPIQNANRLQQGEVARGS